MAYVNREWVAMKLPKENVYFGKPTSVVHFLDPQTFVGTDQSRDYCSTGAWKTFSCLQVCTWILVVPGSFGGKIRGICALM